MHRHGARPRLLQLAETGQGGRHPGPAERPCLRRVATPVIVAKRCRFELDNGSGATIRVQLVGYDAADIEALARGFGDAR